MANKLKAITTRAKVLYKSGKYAKWTDAIKAASKQIGTQSKPAIKKKAAPKKSVKKAAIKKAAPKRKTVSKKMSGTNDKVITGMFKKFTAVFFPVGFPVVTASVDAENVAMAKRLAKKWAVSKGIKVKPSTIKIWPVG